MDSKAILNKNLNEFKTFEQIYAILTTRNKFEPEIVIKLQIKVEFRICNGQHVYPKVEI